MTIYLEMHPPIRKQYRSPRRAKPTGAIVVHTAESEPILVLPDDGATNVAHFISTRTDPGSYHSVSDSNATVHVGRYEWEMFGEATGGNPWALHLAFACKAHLWPTLPADWVEEALRNGALEAARMAAWVLETTGVIVPARRITAAEYRAGKPGFIGHGDLDPLRRTDPGARFPWNAFLNIFSDHTGEPPMPTYQQRKEQAAYRLQSILLANGVDLGTTGPEGNGRDLDAGPATLNGACDVIENLHRDLTEALADATNIDAAKWNTVKPLVEDSRGDLADLLAILNEVLS